MKDDLTGRLAPFFMLQPIGVTSSGFTELASNTASSLATFAGEGW
ncbi:hypothetical protein [Shewanella woodyi]|nr:hypothetical protein [Shewanella woodyi]